MVPRAAFRWILGGLLVVGGVLRYWLAFHVFRAQGFAWDLSTFGDWMETIRTAGPEAYATDPSINYPPVFAQLLDILNRVGLRVPGSSEPEIGDGPWLLLKWLPVLADLGVAGLVAYAGRRWYSPGTGLWAAGLYLFIPVTWYDSAIWGQMDSVAALPVLASLVLLASGLPEWAALAFMLGVLTKPQAALALLVLLPALIGLARARRLPWWRLATTAGAGLLAFVGLVNRWSLSIYVDSDAGHIPVVGNIIGLARQYFATADLFPYLSVNAFNPWALVGEQPMAQQFQAQDVIWLSDSYRILGMQARLLGLVGFALVVLLSAWTLLRRPSADQLFVTSALLFTAFFVLPTRVHERYLVQAFAVLALVWARRWWQRVVVVLLALVNTANLHAVLVGGLRISTDMLSQADPIAQYPHQGMPPEFYGFSWPQLPVFGVLDHRVVLFDILVVVLAFALLIVDSVRRSASRQPVPAALVE